MPNWCNNNLTVTSDDPKLIAFFEKAFDSDGIFNYFIPNPNGEWNYAWSVENWGVKWDIKGEDINVIQIDEDRIIISFDTAWGPPLQFYEHLEELGFEVVGMYYEPGMAFCGIYNNGYDEYYEYDGMTYEEVKATIPDELDDCFLISEYVRDEQEDD